MLRSSLLLLLILSGIATGYAQKNTMASQWRDSVIAIDGDPVDWEQPFRYYDSKSKLQYTFVNDATALYVCLKTADDRTMMKIIRAGMRVWLDTTGKKKEIAAIYFPVKGEDKLDISPDPNEPEKNIVERADIKKLKLTYTTSSQEVRTQGLKGVPVSMMPADSVKYGLRVGMNWDREDMLTYEIRIPFSLFYKDRLNPDDTLKPIGLGVKIEAMVLPMMTGASTTDVTGTGGNPTMNRSMNSTARPGSSPGPQPSMSLPQNIADMGQPLQMYTRLRLAYR